MAGVKTLHRDYMKFAPKWKRARDVVAGTDAIHEAGTEYLPKLKNETSADYAARLRRSDYWNGTWRTIDALVGMAHRKPPTVDVPTAIEPYLEDINLKGMTMESLAKECLEEELSLGRFGILVDHPPQKLDSEGNVVPLSVAVAQKMGLRPTLQLYPTESIRNWKYRRLNNAWVLSMVILGESEAVAIDEFTDESEERYRVLDLDERGLYRQRVFSSGKGANNAGDVLLSEFYPVMNGKPLGFIPFYIGDPNGKGDCIDEPPLIDLIDANLALYQMNAIYRHTLYFCPPTFYISGYQLSENETVSVGGTAALVFPDPDAKAGYAEPEGNMVPALREAMLDKKQEMALLGARMIGEETKVAETFGAQQIKRQGENAVLSKIVQSVSELLEKALLVFAQWAGQPVAKVTYQINRDFLPAGMDAQQLTALLAAVAAGEMSSESFFALLQRADLVASDLSFKDEQGRIEIQNPAPVAPTKQPPAQGAAA